MLPLNDPALAKNQPQERLQKTALLMHAYLH